MPRRERSRRGSRRPGAPRYDIAISRWFAEKGEDFPPLHVRAYEKVVDLPYGENPHQRAAFYAQAAATAVATPTTATANAAISLIRRRRRTRPKVERRCASRGSSSLSWDAISVRIRCSSIESAKSATSGGQAKRLVSSPVIKIFIHVQR